jgi:hypothetical protein
MSGTSGHLCISRPQDSRCQDEAMELLELSGARSDVKDYEDMTLAQLLKEMTLLNARTKQ